MKRILLSIVALSALQLPAFSAAVAINLFADSLRDASGNPLPDGALVQLVVDPANNGFGDPARNVSREQVAIDPAFGSEIKALSFVGSSVDDVVVATFAISSANSGSAGGLFEALNISYDPNTYRPGLTIAQGMPMLLRWWPGKTTASPNSSVLAGDRFGEYRTTSVVDGSEIAWNTPAVGGLYALNVTSPVSGGSATVSQLTSRVAVVPVPEPSVLGLATIGILSLIGRRRRS
jgi:PEP-CTERM motif